MIVIYVKGQDQLLDFYLSSHNVHYTFLDHDYYEIDEDYKRKYDKVCYYVDFSRTTPIMIRYKKRQFTIV